MREDCPWDFNRPVEKYKIDRFGCSNVGMISPVPHGKMVLGQTRARFEPERFQHQLSERRGPNPLSHVFGEPVLHLTGFPHIFTDNIIKLLIKWKLSVEVEAAVACCKDLHYHWKSAIT